MTNKNGFWIGWLDLLTPPFTISLNHNQLQQLTINDCLRFSSILTGLQLSSILIFFYCDLRMNHEWILLYDWMRSESESKLFYDWRLTADQFILVSSPLKITTTDFFNWTLSGNSPYVTSLSDEKMGLSLMNMVGLTSSVNFVYMACYWILPFPLYASPLSV
jgi:hypothetical protein